MDISRKDLHLLGYVWLFTTFLLEILIMTQLPITIAFLIICLEVWGVAVVTKVTEFIQQPDGSYQWPKDLDAIDYYLVFWPGWINSWIHYTPVMFVVYKFGKWKDS